MPKVPVTVCAIGIGLASAVLLSSAGLLATVVVLGGITVAAIGLARPRLLAPLALFTLYANLPVVAVKYHGVPATLAVVPMLALGVPLIRILLVRREPVIVDGVLKLMFVFLCVLLVAGTFAEDRGLAWSWISVFCTEGILLYFLLVNSIREKAMLRAVVWTLLVAGAFMGCACVYSELSRSYASDLGGLVQRKTAPDEIAGPDTVARDRLDGSFSTSRRASGPIGEVNRFAQVLLVLLPLAYFRYRGEKHPALRAAALLLGGAILAGFLLTYSRSAFLVVVALLLLLCASGHLRLVHLVAVGTALLVLVLSVPGYRARVESIAEVRALGPHARSVEADGATRGRLTEMLAAFRVFVDHPLIGVGPGQYLPFYSMKYQVNSKRALRYIPMPRRAHSLYLELAAETGVVGLASFLAIPILLLRRLRRIFAGSSQDDPELANLAVACWFSIIAYLGMGVFLHLAFQRYFWVLVALGGIAVQLSRGTVTVVAGSGPVNKEEIWLPSH